MITDKHINIDIEERAAQGVENFKKGYNCSQAVVATFADVYDLGDEFLSMASSFGGGMGRLRMTSVLALECLCLPDCKPARPTPPTLARET